MTVDALGNVKTNKKSVFNISYTKKKKAVKIALTLFMVIIGISMVLPFAWMVSASFKKPLDVLKYPIEWIPKYWYPVNFIEVWSGKYVFINMYLNSIKVTLISVAGSVITSAMAGYGFARIKFGGRDKIFLLMIATMIIPPQVTMVPRFILFDVLDFINTHWSLILPGSFTVFGVFMMRQFFIQVPFELSEAARIDGAGEIRTFYRIILPMAKTAVVTLMILTFCWYWNDYENPLIFLRDKELLTIPVGLNSFVDENVSMENLIMAASTLSIIPIFIIFLAGQKYFIEGMTTGAVKG